MLGFCQNWIFGQKFDFSNSVLYERRWENWNHSSCQFWIDKIHNFQSMIGLTVKSWWTFNTDQDYNQNRFEKRMLVPVATLSCKTLDRLDFDEYGFQGASRIGHRPDNQMKLRPNYVA